MTKIRWFTLGAAAAMFGAIPAYAEEGQHHETTHTRQATAAETHGGAMHQDGAAAQPKANSGKKAKGRTVAVAVTKEGFVPAEITARKGEVLNLVVTRKVEKTCATELVQKDQKIYAPLPLDKPVTVTLRAPKEGQLAFSCAHGHIAGNVVAQ